MMLPVIALVGRPNVGKSTLFNRLTNTRNALVADFPGLTRDRQYGECTFLDKKWLLVDTGGIGVDDIEVDTLMSKQSAIALEEANLVFFIVDGRAGLTGVDAEIAKRLHKSGKQVIVIVNKIDGSDENTSMAEFFSLGFESVFSISAAHGRGIMALLAWIAEQLPEVEEIAALPNQIKIAFIGRPNAGKSTLINRILGEERVVVYDMPGTTRDSIAIPFERAEQQYLLIDTAGIRRRARINGVIEKFSVIKTIQAIDSSHVCLLLIDAKEGVSDQDLHLLGLIIEAGRALVILVNKWDNLEEEKKQEIKTKIEYKLTFAQFAKIRFISALHGTGVGLLFKDIKQAYDAACKKLSTPYLTRLLQDISSQHPPPLVNGRRIKLRYAHAGGHNPPLIVIHGNQVDSLPDSYKRYLNNHFMKHIGLTGTPLKLEFKGGDNPYKNKKNKLTERQVNKRKRLIRKIKKK